MTEYLLPLKNVITNIPLFVVLNIFFIIATYTDIKWMKIYNKFNIAMLLIFVLCDFIDLLKKIFDIKPINKLANKIKKYMNILNNFFNNIRLK